MIKKRRRNYFAVVSVIATLWAVLLLAMPQQEVAAQGGTCGGTDLGGTIWRDYNANGAKESGEPGYSQAGMSIVAFDDTGAQVATATINSDGTYRFANLFTSYSAVRVELEGLTGGTQEGASGSQNNTGVERYVAASCSADIGVNYPTDYCQANPGMAATCVQVGDPAVPTAGEPTTTLYGFNYNTRGYPVSPTNAYVAQYSAGASAPSALATKSETGPVYGLAYNRETKIIYMSSLLRRHAGFKDNKPGVIYQHDVATGANSTFVDMNTLLYGGSPINVISPGTTYQTNTARGIGAFNTASLDTWAYTWAGASGIGDIDISDDNSTLYVMNIGDKAVYGIDTTSKTAVSKYPTGDPLSCGTNGGGAWYPFALKYHHGSLYMGGVCQYSVTKSIAGDDAAGVFRWNGSAWTKVVSFQVDYPKQLAFNVTECLGLNGWYDWIGGTAMPTWCTGAKKDAVVRPAPILSDIEFDEQGNLIMAFMDRAGIQWGWRNMGPDGTAGNYSNKVGYVIITGGDILRATNSGGSYTIEPVVTSSSAVAGDEFFKGDGRTAASTGPHPEQSFGSLALLPGSQHVVMTTMAPTHGNSGGVKWINTTTGLLDHTVGADLWKNNLEFYTNADDPGYSGKGNGVGDIELLCDLAPVEIGNYVWLDSNKNGRQDPSETPISGVVVTLWSDPDGIPGNVDDVQVGSSTTTNAKGEYYFDVEATKNYYVAIDETDPALATYVPTTLDYGGNINDTDDDDSDGQVDGNGVMEGVAGKIIIPFTAGEAGENNYTYDYGFSPDTTTATTLAYMTTTSTDSSILFQWATVSEETTDYFNVYRSTSPDDVGTQLNAEPIAAQNTGLSQGASYEYADVDVVSGVQYYYTLELWDTDGTSERVGPVLGVLESPTAINLDRFDATNSGLPLAPLLAAGLLAMAGFAIQRRRNG